MKIFISHIHDEKPIAENIKKIIDAGFMYQIQVFFSSEDGAIRGGEQWLNKVKKEIKESELILVLCSPASIIKQWINFEIGCGWINENDDDVRIIPIVHSGLTYENLPIYLKNKQVYKIDDNNFIENLFLEISTRFGTRWKDINFKELQEKLNSTINLINYPNTSPLIIDSVLYRTELIVRDLKKLLYSDKLKGEVVWTSAFLTSLAIGPEDPYSGDEQDYIECLLEEKELLLELARNGCEIRCIISPPNEHNTFPLDNDFTKLRTVRLKEFLNSKDSALNSIKWAISECWVKNIYIIGKLSIYEGYKTGMVHGYSLTLRHTAPEILKSYLELYDGFFENLEARTLAIWTSKEDKAFNKRELIKTATIRCLEDSIKYLRCC
jgi:hypothetical protein